MAETANPVDTTSREIRSSRAFDARRTEVFKLWTTPEYIGQWWGPRGFTVTTEKMDFRPGGEWIFEMHGPDGGDYANRIVYDEIMEPERLVYTHVSGPKFRATVTFDEQEGKTTITWIMLFETEELRNRVAAEFGALEGLNQTVTRLGEAATRLNF
jgi:uncharacterized protein YndB with AHSA1/START domain